MIVIHNSNEMRAWSLARKMEGKSVGFVPTMGYLHEGHLSLIDEARKNSDEIVVSIFVNPTQFGPNEDFDTYPRDEERDLKLCEGKNVSAVFMPPVEEMYPEQYFTYVNIEKLDRYLCGASRENHFRGVCTIVSKLFNIVIPDIAVFGQKDAQQARIIESMTTDLQFGIKIIVAPIVRENDGLAMSSRNVRLEPEHRKQAKEIHAGIRKVENAVSKGISGSKDLISIFKEHLDQNAPDSKIDYVELVHWDLLEPLDKIEDKALFAVAVFFGKVRLIDNTLLRRI